MNDTPAPFAPFLPASPPVAPEAEKPAKQSRKKGAIKTIVVTSGGTETKLSVEHEKPVRQKRRATGEPKTALKFDLQTILSAAALLNADDQAAFEKLVGILSDAGKPGRERLLAAIGKIFE